MTLVWSPLWSIGHALIDAQHRELVERIAALELATSDHRPEQLQEMLDFLGNYVIEHFGTEERLMDQFGYPDLDRHKRAHAGFIDTWTRIREEFLAEGATAHVFVGLNLRLAGWLTDHVFRVDRELGRFLRQQDAA